MSYSAYTVRQTADAQPTEIELRALGFVTHLLSSATSDSDRVHALRKNHDLWMILTIDLGLPDNPLPQSLKAELISLGLWSMRYSLRAMSEPLDLSAIIEVNKNIAGGLADQTRRPVLNSLQQEATPIAAA